MGYSDSTELELRYSSRAIYTNVFETF